VLGAVNEVTNFAAYNICIFSSPKQARDFHFHIEILPFASRYGGFERTSGVVQLNIPLEAMAGELRAALTACMTQTRAQKGVHSRKARSGWASGAGL
jgi:galactose-1-phosphate uridylyltransferase